MQTLELKLNDNDYMAMKSFADETKKNVYEYAQEKLIEALENEVDYKRFSEFSKKEHKYYSSDEAKRMLGL